MKRRNFLHATAGLISVAASVNRPVHAAEAKTSQASTDLPGTQALPVQIPSLARMEARPDRIIALNVCTRPFREQGPRIETERMGRKTVVHNYGHGGSGWSLSWGTAELAVEQAKAANRNEVAVIGCGAVGLTTAIQAQRAGMKVTIYAKERPPYVRSSFATGVWSPESRICTAEHASAFGGTWERMARYSHRRFQSLMGTPGKPVEWIDIYNLADKPFDEEAGGEGNGEPEYPAFTRDLIQDITPQALDLTGKAHPFPVPFVQRYPLMLFNISTYSRFLIAEFIQGGGEIVTYEFNDPGDFSTLSQRLVINCTGYGAKALLGDDSIVPVRGQTAKLIPQPEVKYGIRYGDQKISAYPRTDGMLVQTAGENDYNNPVANIDPQESIAAVNRLATVMAQLR